MMLFVKIDFLFVFVFEGRYERDRMIGLRRVEKNTKCKIRFTRLSELQLLITEDTRLIEIEFIVLPRFYGVYCLRIIRN